MIETTLRKPYERFLIEPLLRVKGIQKIHPIVFTGAAFLSGIAVFPMIVLGSPVWASIFLAVSGFLDTFDGSVARYYNRASSKGAALDIVSDRTVEFAVVLALFFVDTSARAAPSLLMLGTILICVTSFLVVGIFTENETEKSFYYNPGLIERAEAFIFFEAMILLPAAFTFLAYLFSFLVLMTAVIRMVQFLGKR